MNVEIRTEVPQFPEKEYIKGTFLAVQAPCTDKKIIKFSHVLENSEEIKFTTSQSYERGRAFEYVRKCVNIYYLVTHSMTKPLAIYI
jgi:hypothetical protein